MVSSNQNFELIQGVDKTVTFTETGSVNLTGSTLTWILADRPNGTTALSISGGAITLDSTGAVVNVTVNDTDTSSLEGEYYHELLAVDTNGIKNILSTGWILIHPSQQT